jgi:hypothetical protein
MKKFEIITSVNNGKLTRNRNIILQAIKSFENTDVILILEKPKKKRSSPQNRYYHGLLVPLMQQGSKDLFGEVWSMTKAHEHLKNKFLFHESVNQKTGEIIQTPKSTTELTTTEWEIYMTEIRIYLLENFDIEAPEPNEKITLNF